jgi:hypothetical protein
MKKIFKMFICKHNYNISKWSTSNCNRGSFPEQHKCGKCGYTDSLGIIIGGSNNSHPICPFGKIILVTLFLIMHLCVLMLTLEALHIVS